MSKSILPSLVIVGVLLSSDPSATAGPIDYPGPGYRQQREMIYHPKRDKLFRVQTGASEVKTSFHLELQSSSVDFSQPIRLFSPQAPPTGVTSVPSVSPLQK